MTTSDPGLLFDIDGTLCDTNFFHTIAWARALHDIGRDDVPMATIHSYIGMGSSQFVKAVVGVEADSPAGKGALDGHARHFEAFFPEIRRFDGARELLQAVTNLGTRVMLATSSDPEQLAVLRQAIDADDCVVGVTSADDVDAAKPEPDIFVAAMKKAELDPRRTMVVGDTVWDIEAARRAGLDCVAVLTGGTDSHTLREAGAAAVYDNPRALLDDLSASPLSSLWAAG